jgi:hypothetical protein
MMYIGTCHMCCNPYIVYVMLTVPFVGSIRQIPPSVLRTKEIYLAGLLLLSNRLIWQEEIALGQMCERSVELYQSSGD